MKAELVTCGSTRHTPFGCEELHIPALPGDECPVCRKKTRDAWRRQKELSDAAQKTGRSQPREDRYETHLEGQHTL
jgi:hypothetical protein